MSRTIKQFSVANDGECRVLYALADDGTLWRLLEHSDLSSQSWHQLPGLPKPEKKPVDAATRAARPRFADTGD